MGWFTKTIDSSLGKKLIMSLTGLFLVVFLIEHLIGNLLLLLPDKGKSFMAYADFMDSPENIVVRAIEILLFIFLIYHIINGIRLWLGNRKARPVKYKLNRPSENSTFFSRFMIQSGSIIFIFLIIHLETFFIPYRFGHPSDTMYEGAVKAFSSTWYSCFYVFAMILLAFHLTHGVQSSFQTLGIRHNKYTIFIKKCGIVFSLLICLGFAIIPLFFLFGGGR